MKRAPGAGGGPAPRERGLSKKPLLAVGLGAAVLLAACGGDDEPELTFEDRLNLLAESPLTAAEVAERAAVGQALCRLDGAVLDEVWLRLDEDQLDFQDIVFSMLCPERATLYAGHTGRYVTEEAEQSGVVTSTTRPTTSTSTTSTTPRPTLTRTPTTATAGDPGSATTAAGSAPTGATFGTSATPPSSAVTPPPTTAPPTTATSPTTRPAPTVATTTTSR